jgi:nucleoside-diphosphate-sugar epimerase
MVAALARHPDIEEVLAIDIRRPEQDEQARLRWCLRDVRDPNLERDLEGIDALVHLAFRVLGRGEDAVSVNVDGSRHVFAAALGSGVRTIVHASSAAAYGSAPDNPVPLTEASPLRPLPPFYYPQTKVAVETILDELERGHPDVRFVRMRPVSTLGPGAPSLLSGRALVWPADFDPLMQFTWIDDVVGAFVAALLRPGARGAFNVGAPDPVPLSAVGPLAGVRSVRIPYRTLRGLSRLTCALRVPGALHPGWVASARYPIVVDTSRAAQELGWHASDDCATAVRRYGELLRASRRDGTPIAATVGEAE